MPSIVVLGTFYEPLPNEARQLAGGRLKEVMEVIALAPHVSSVYHPRRDVARS